MNPQAYLDMAETESSHWWFLGRRTLIAAMIKKLKLPPHAQILEVGCGTGGNLTMLSNFGDVYGLEMDPTALAIAAEKTHNRFDIRAGCCPHDIPFQNQRFDLICLFDVLEHIADDNATLLALKPLLSETGRIVITVPAYPWLYSTHDSFLHHKRRYLASPLGKQCVALGFKVIKLSYFNTILFPLAVAVRFKDKWLGNAASTGTATPPKAINKLLLAVFAAERWVLAHGNLPYGVSLICILKANDGN